MGILSRIRKTFHSPRHSAEIQEELQFHLDMDTAAGHDPRQAHLRLGNLTRIQEDTRAMGIVEWLDSAAQDVRYAFRQFRKSPAMSLAVVLSLTIGIGANTAIFSLIDAALLKPLPVQDPDSLRIVEWLNDGFPAGVTNINGSFSEVAGRRGRGTSISANLYRRLAHEQTSVASLIGIAGPDSVAIAVDASPAEQVSLQYVSDNFFQGLGAMPIVGRPFRAEEDRVGQEPVVVVSHRFWTRRLAANPAAVDQFVRINNVPARIAGVAPAGFFGLKAGQWTDVYAPLAMRVAFRAPAGNATPRGEDDSDWWVRQMARLKPGLPEPAAIARLADQFRNMPVPQFTAASPKTLPELIAFPGRHGFDALNTKDANALWILMLLVAVLLLIVCANVANLLLSRSVGRQRESAVRLALGAARTRLFRQHLIESGVLAMLGGAAGLAVGYVLARAVHLLFQTGRDPSSAFDLHLDLRALAYTAALSILTAVLFGLAPAVRAARSDLGVALKAQTRSVMGGRLRLPRLLVSVQIALCFAALVAAGLLGRTLQNLQWTDVGFARENVAYASLSPSRAGYSPERVAAYVDRVRAALARVPGVQRVSLVAARPLSGNGNNGLLNFPGRPLNRQDRTNMNSVGDGFFETLGIPLIAGRTFEPRDLRPNVDLVVVDEIFVKRFFPNENPLGRRFGFGPGQSPGKDTGQLQIAGVVGNSRFDTLRGDAYPTVYEPFRPVGSFHFAIRTTIDPTRLAEPVRQAVASIDPAVPLIEFRTQTALIDRLLRTERLLGFLSAAFGVLALTLAAIGLAGLLTYAVARRTNEIGVRMALGAATGDVIRMVLRDSLWMVGTGILVGLPCAYAIARILKTSLYRMEPLDPRTAALSFLALLAVALLAAWIPATRAAHIDPITALREE